MAEQLQIVGPAYTARSLPANAQELVNLYLETGGPAGRDMILGTPGLVLKTTATSSPGRRLFVLNGTLYLIAGDNLYSVSSAHVATLIGSVAGTALRPRVVINDVTGVAFITRGSAGYTFDGTTLTKITDADFPATANGATLLGGSFLTASTGVRFYGSDTNDGANWNGLWFASVTGIGNVVSVLEDHDELFVFGDKGIQVYDWIPNGTAFPFSIRRGAKIEVGCAAEQTIAQLDNSFAFLGKNENGQGRIYKAQGYQATNITAPAIEAEIETYGDISDAFAFTYAQAGHEFYVITFPSAGVTWVYDAAVGNPLTAWHRRESYLRGYWRASDHAFAYGRHYVCDYNNGNVYELRLDVYDEAGELLIAKRTFPHLPAGRFPYLRIELESGVGLVDGTEPELMLEWSDDGAKTFGHLKTRSMGKIGEYGKLLMFHGLGYSRKMRTFKLSISAPVKRAIIGAEWEYNQSA